MKIIAGFALVLSMSLPLTAAPKESQTITGRVGDVHDGDTFRLDDGTRIRLWGIDAPELRQECQDSAAGLYACGLKSKLALATFAVGKSVSCYPKGKSYNRIVAQCSVDGVDLGALMVGSGQAIDYKRYSKGWYLPYQESAQAHLIGLWAGEFKLPEDYRREKWGER